MFDAFAGTTTEDTEDTERGAGWSFFRVFRFLALAIQKQFFMESQ